jgi:hypothetical protein
MFGGAQAMKYSFRSCRLGIFEEKNRSIEFMNLLVIEF